MNLYNGIKGGKVLNKELASKIKDQNAKIAIVGLGYVGLPLILRYAEVGFSVVGIDVDEKKISDLNNGKSYIEHIPEEKIKKLVSSGRFFATTDFEELSKCDVIVLCVPTPLTKNKEPDLSFVKKTVNSLLPFIRNGHLISLESTTYPGTTEEEIVAKIENQGFEVGKDIHVVYSPEREDPGNINYKTSTIPKICGGHTDSCTKIGSLFYEKAIDKVVPVSTTRTAEMTKLLENIHRAVNIGLVNEMKIVADSMDIDIYEVIDAASTKPFGFTAYYPGPGLGGHCIPIDPFYLTWKAKEYGISTKFIELSGEINESMPNYVIDKLTNALNSSKKSISGSKILILGIAYKKNVDDMRESPAVEIMEKLRKKGAQLSYSDPHVKIFPKMRKHDFDLSSVNLTSESLSSFDAVVLVTDHDKFDYGKILKHSKLIIDTRGKFREKLDKIINA